MAAQNSQGSSDTDPVYSSYTHFSDYKFSQKERDGILFMLKKPEIRHISEAPENKWHEVYVNCDHKVFAPDRTVTMLCVYDFIRGLKNEYTTRDITVLSGTHGNRFGRNWTNHGEFTAVDDFPEADRSAKSLERGFYVEDKELYNKIPVINEREIKVIDMKDVDIYMFNVIIHDNRHDVILAYCFGRNDEALRHFLNIDPVISYV